jgi:hypothetical protein
MRRRQLEVLLDAHHDAGKHSIPTSTTTALMHIIFDPIIASPFVLVGGRRPSSRVLLVL